MERTVKNYVLAYRKRAPTAEEPRLEGEDEAGVWYVAFYVHKDVGVLNWHLEFHKDNLCRTATLWFNTTNFGWIPVHNVYNHRHQVDFDKLLSHTSGTDLDVYVGDWNAHDAEWFATNVTIPRSKAKTEGGKLHKAMREAGMKLLTKPGTPTWRGGKFNAKTTTIDLAFGAPAIAPLVIECGLAKEYTFCDTDHHVTKIVFDLEPACPPSGIHLPKSIRGRKRMLAVLQRNIKAKNIQFNDLDTPAKIDAAFRLLSEAIRDTIENYRTHIGHKRIADAANTPEIRAIREEARKARNQSLESTGQLRDKYAQEARDLDQKAAEQSKLARNVSYWSSIGDLGLGPKPYTVADIAESISRRKLPMPHMDDLVLASGQVVSSATEKALTLLQSWYRLISKERGDDLTIERPTEGVCPPNADVLSSSSESVQAQDHSESNFSATAEVPVSTEASEVDDSTTQEVHEVDTIEPDDHYNTMELSDLDDVSEEDHEIYYDENGNLLQKLRNSELRKLIGGTKCGKAPGDDLVTTDFIKISIDILLPILEPIFDACFKLSYFPIQFRTTVIVPLRKKDKEPHTSPGDWRPIALESCIGKLFERAMTDRLVAEATKRNLIPFGQFGCRGRDTTKALQTLIDPVYGNWLLPNNQKLQSSLLCFDIEGAFNNVDQKKLLRILEAKGIPDWMRSLIASFLSARLTKVTVPGYPDVVERYVNVGVPQGSPLSPILFMLFASPLLENFAQKEQIGKQVAVVSYIDDMYLLVASKSHSKNLPLLKKYFAEIQKAADDLGITFKPSKFDVMHFLDPRDRSVPEFTGVPDIPGLPATLEVKKEIKILGVWVDNKLTWYKHVDEVSVAMSSKGVRLC